ncbi:uncharacterized protein LOC124205820 [Daphnia pulex]|uniref:uncharacterized protein LOC124205820 n=1 Tax=Daphnia pulex TaxID=6669 RepID=UPI001EDECC9B|nr:uncharacterized protein LOC124205820 [Daphnia pulex]
MKMIRFSIPVLLILCCSIICFSFGTVDAQGDSGKTAKSEVKTEKPGDKQVGKTAGKPGDKSANKLGLVNKPRKPNKIKKAEPAKSTKPDDVQTKIGELENLVKKLKNQLDNSNAKQQDLLKNVAELETKVKTLEKILPSIFDQIARKIPDIPMGEIRRTCAEIRAMDVSIPSGMQWIDPDGQGVGETPIYVYCDMTTGSTTIKHDSLAPINVDHCAGAGCYSRSIKYEASMAQIKALTDLSSECRQSITYDCFNAPHKLENTMYSWWNDRNGNSQYFWAGNNAYGIPTCQCGIDGNCAVSSVMCNCDSLAQRQLSDKGVITDKNILPITRLHFGRTQSQSSSGIHTLGNLTCSGYSRQPEPSTKPAEIATPMPTSCDDLKDMGYTLSGFFSIKGHKMMESVYCDFTDFFKIPVSRNLLDTLTSNRCQHIFTFRETKNSTSPTPQLRLILSK